MTKKNSFSPVLKVGLITYGLLVVVSVVVCVLIGLVSLQALGFGLITAGLIVALFAAYGFMGQSAQDCDERMRYAPAAEPVLDYGADSTLEGLCVNRLALGIGIGSFLALISGVLLAIIA